MRSTRPRISSTRPEATPGHFLRLGSRLLLIALLVFPPHLTAATITVSGGCTLPDAIDAANSDAPAGGCPAGSGADTIELTGDVTLTTPASYGYGANGLPLVTSDITIAGNGFTIERDSSAPPFRLFIAAPSTTLALESVTVSGGSAASPLPFFYDFGGAILTLGSDLSLTDSTVSGNSSGFIGGGIASFGGSVSLTDSTVSGNSAAAGGGAANFFGTLSMTNSSISGNSAVYTPYVSVYGLGGGIIVSNGSAVLTDSAVADNYAELAGGGSFAESSSSIELVRSTVSGNEAPSGGGGMLAGSGSTTTLTNSTVSGNSSRRGAGGLSLYSAGATTITNTTFSGNYTYGRGRGASSIYADSSGVTLSGSVLGNALEYSGVGVHCNVSGTVTDLGGNLADDSSCGTVPATLTGLDPVLADNGGPTLTHALADTSSAVDAAGACGLATDQRGVARDDGSCDSGAYEFVAPPTPEELVDLLIDTVESLGLPGGLENALVGKLESALASLADGNVGAAINKLGAFINQVEAQSGKKIDAADAAALIAAAEAIIDLLSG